jgi:hypothetical protein
MPGSSYVPSRLSDLTGDLTLASVARDDQLVRGASGWQNIPGPEVWLSAHGGGPSASAAANSAAVQEILDLYPSGVKILCRSGTHQFATAGTVVSDAMTNPYCVRLSAAHGPVAIVGTGATTFKLADAQTLNTAILLVRGTAAGYRTARTIIEGIEFDGNQANQSGTWDDFAMVTSIYAYDTTVQFCYLRDSRNFSFHAHRDSRGFAFLNSRIDGHNGTAIGGGCYVEIPDALVAYCRFFGHDSNATGVMLNLGCNADIQIPGEFITVVFNKFKGGVVPLSAGGIRHSQISHNQFFDVSNNNGCAMRLETFNHAITDYDFMHNIIDGNMFSNIREAIRLGSQDATFGCKVNRIVNNRIHKGTVNLTFGIRETGTAAGHFGNEYEGNLIEGASIAPFTVLSGSNARVGQNYYGAVGSVKPIEARGTAIMTSGGTTVSVTHGLAATPTKINVTPQGDPAGRVYVDTIGSSTFRIVTTSAVGGDTVFGWYAEV